MSGERLARRYRRLLRAYPRGPRRDELLDTLVEAAPPHRRRPTAAETVNLVRHGLRARLGRPGSKAVVVVAVLVALSAGYAAAALSARLAWNGVPDYPTGARLAEITGSVYPGLPVDGERTGDGLFFDIREQTAGERLLNGRDEDFGWATYDFGPDGNFIAGDYRRWTDAAVGRLTDAGWTVHDVWPTGATWIATGKLDETGRSFTASRGDLAIEVEAATDVSETPAGNFYANASLTRLAPRWVDVLTAAGWLLGVAAGWLLTGWVSRRTEEPSPPVRVLSHGSAYFALLLTAPLALTGTAGMLVDLWKPHTPYPPFWSLSLTYGYKCLQLAVLLAIVSLLTAAFRGRPAADPLAEA